MTRAKLATLEPIAANGTRPARRGAATTALRLCGTTTDMVLDLAQLTTTPWAQMIMPDDAMAPTYPTGWAVFVDTSAIEPAIGLACAIEYSGTFYIRRLGGINASNGARLWLPDNWEWPVAVCTPEEAPIRGTARGCFWSRHGLEERDGRLVALGPNEPPRGVGD
jgi:hypothetical protein